MQARGLFLSSVSATYEGLMGKLAFPFVEITSTKVCIFKVLNAAVDNYYVHQKSKHSVHKKYDKQSSH